MTGKRSLTVLAAVLALVMLCSVLFIALEADHDCQGDDCAVCAQISACVRLIEHLALSALAAAAAAVLPEAAPQAKDALARACHGVSLISLKVKLSD